MEDHRLLIGQYYVEPAYGATEGGVWLVWHNCPVCRKREIVARFLTKDDARMWAVIKSNQTAFDLFCRTAASSEGVDPKDWIYSKDDE